MHVRLSSHRWGIAALGFAAGAAMTVWLASAEPHLSATAAAPVAPAPALAPLATTSYADAVTHAAPAVVTIRIEKRAEASPAADFSGDPFLQRFFGPQQPTRRRNAPNPAPIEEGLGSGVIVTADGNILTNNHVVDGADRVTVALTDGREFPAKVVGTDAPTDLAVVHIDATNLPILPLADSDRARVGDVVLAVGNPLGIGQTVTMGIISAKGRTTSSGNGSYSSPYEDFLQTDAPINQGNSGGALITTGGELIGINSQMLSSSGGSIGIGFAIPSNMAHNVMTQLVGGGKVRRGMLGVSVQPVTSDLAKSLGLSSVHGALINDVTADSPAAKAGIEAGDVILQVNGTAVNDSNDLRNHVSALAPGTKVALSISRHGQARDVTAVLGEMPAESAKAPEAHATSDALGLTLQALTPSLAEQLQLPRGTTGLAVTDVASDSAAARAGLRPGDVIRAVDGQPVHSAVEVRDAVGRKTDRPALVTVQRDGRSFFVPLGGR